MFPDACLQKLAIAAAAAIGAIGLGLVTGYAGQVSLGHAFFMAIGAYTAAVISGDPEARVVGYGVEEILVWLPAAGIVAAVAGVIVAPLATRLRGLYLAIVTLGLVFIGQHIFQQLSDITGGTNIGRPAPTPSLFGEPLYVTGARVHPRPEAVLAHARAPGHLRAGRAQPGPLAGGPRVHRHPGPGHRRRRDRREPGPVQDGRVRRLVVLRRLRAARCSTS